MDFNFFDEKKQEKAIKWLEEKWLKDHRKCEICTGEEWTVSPELLMPIPYIGESMSIGGSAFPHVLLICNTCGNTKFFNAVLMGVVPQEDNSDEE